MSIECEGCGCIKNYDNESEFCGRLFSQDGKVSTVGCNKKCDECKSCDYSSDNKNIILQVLPKLINNLKIVFEYFA